jgi:GPH family glycoside/pentoside/hexuronide:cation symporter
MPDGEKPETALRPAGSAQRPMPTLTTTTSALYGLGGLASNSTIQLFGFLLLFYNQLVGLDARLVSLAISLSILVDALWDPIVGQLSDSTRSRLGRRHPYIYGAAIPAAVTFALLFMPPRGWGQGALFAWLLGFVVVGRMFDSLQEIPGSALMPELTRDYDRRTALQAWRYFFGVVFGGAISVFLGYGLFLKSTRAEPFGQLRFAGYAPYAATIAAIGAVAVIVSALATQRFASAMHQPPARRPRLGETLREMGSALGNRNFLALAVSALIFGVSVGISSGLLSYFYTYFWELRSSVLLIIRLTALPAGVLGVLVAPLAARTLGKKRTCLIVFFLAVFSTTVPIGGRLIGIMPANGTSMLLAILIVDTMATAALATIGFVVVISMLADVVEANQVRTGQRNEGLLFAAESLLRKFSTSFATLLPGLLLAFVHFPSHARPGHVPQAVLTNLALIYLPIITGLTLCSTAAIAFYGIDRASHEANLDHL